MATNAPIRSYRTWYAMLLRLYPRPFRDQFGEGMAQTFHDLCRECRDRRLGLFVFVLWIFFETSMGIVKDETFGPILTVERFTEEAEAISLGNDTEYGLAAGVRTSDPARGERVVRALRHGTVWLNDFGYYTAAAEWGGFGKSGNGRELGPTGLAEYQEIKHIWHNTAPKPAGWFKGE